MTRSRKASSVAFSMPPSSKTSAAGSAASGQSFPPGVQANTTLLKYATVRYILSTAHLSEYFTEDTRAPTQSDAAALAKGRAQSGGHLDGLDAAASAPRPAITLKSLALHTAALAASRREDTARATAAAAHDAVAVNARAGADATVSPPNSTSTARWRISVSNSSGEGGRGAALRTARTGSAIIIEVIKPRLWYIQLYSTAGWTRNRRCS
jgi:hypothetical protein